MSEQLKAATIRALYGAIITAALTFITTLQVTDFADPRRFEIAGLACGAAFFAYMLSRGVTEGIIDSNWAGDAGGRGTNTTVAEKTPLVRIFDTSRSRWANQSETRPSCRR